MNQTDQAKILKAGFTILRRQDYPNPVIKIKTVDRPWVWINYEKFETKAARDRSMGEFLQKDNYVED